MPGKPKGLPKTGGRKKGAANKLTADLRTMILDSLDRAGGIAYLTKQAEEQPAAFIGLVGKVLPKEIKADVKVKVAPGMLMVLQ